MGYKVVVHTSDQSRTYEPDSWTHEGSALVLYWEMGKEENKGRPDCVVIVSGTVEITSKSRVTLPKAPNIRFIGDES